MLIFLGTVGEEEHRKFGYTLICMSPHVLSYALTLCFCKEISEFFFVSQFYATKIDDENCLFKLSRKFPC